MKRLVRKNFFAIALMGTAFVANSQHVVENFQKWKEKNTSVPPTGDLVNGSGKSCDTYTADNTTNIGAHSFVVAPIPKIDTTVMYGGIEVKYSITNGAILPNCNPKIFYNSTTSPAGVITDGVSRGYVELNKAASGSAAGTAGGSFVAGPFSYAQKVNLTTSGTSSARTFKVFTSIDGGTVWTEYTKDGALSTGKGGALFEIAVDAKDPMLPNNTSIKVESYDQIIRIHDFSVTMTITGVSDLFINGNASLRVSDNNVVVSSKEAGVLEILSLNGQVVAESNIVAGAENTLPVSKSGIYVAKLVTGSGMSTRKILIQ